jgi:hypothetical protein
MVKPDTGQANFAEKMMRSGAASPFETALRASSG